MAHTSAMQMQIVTAPIQIIPATLSFARMPRRFHLVRHEDVSGVSGTGVVADGVEFPNGKAVMCWRGSRSSVATYDSMENLIGIHGHEGRTRVEWID